MTFRAVSFLWKSHDADKPHVSQIAKHTAPLQLTRVVDCLVVARVQFHYSYKNFFGGIFCYLPCRRSRRVLYLTRFFLYPAGAAAGSCILLVSVHLVKNFLLSGNTSFSHTSLHPIPTKLGQSDRYLNHYSCTNNDGVRGQDGVTGVKKVIFTKKASSPTEYLASMRDLCICISLTPSTKVMVLKIHPGSFGVTGVKRSFSPKRHQVLQNA